MNTLLKLTLILFAIFCFTVSAVVFFALSRVPTPPSMSASNYAFSDYVSSEMRNYPENSGVRLWSRWFDKVLYEVDRSAEEGFITAEERNDMAQRSFSTYVPKFVEFSLGNFDKQDWGSSYFESDGTMKTDFVKTELDKLAMAKNKYSIEVSTYEGFDVVNTTINDYFDAKSLVRKPSYRGEELTVTILNKQKALLKNERLLRNSGLKRDLVSLPDRIRRSHKELILANPVSSFQPDYEYYLEKVSEFRNLWKGVCSYSETNELLSPACAFLNANIDAINKQYRCSKDLYYTISRYAQNYPGSKSDLHKVDPAYYHSFSY